MAQRRRRVERRRRERRRIVQPSWQQIAEVFIRVLEEKDPYTRGHSQRVQAYATQLATAMKWDEYLVQCTSVAALLHDIGKIVVERSTLLNQRTTLTAEQWNELTNHPIDGAQMVRGLFPIEVVMGILQHHERMDGDVAAKQYPAYPFGFSGGQIHPIARIIAICDTFDALTSKRTYNSPVSKEEALAYLKKGAGTRHDAAMIKTFVDQVAPSISLAL